MLEAIRVIEKLLSKNITFEFDNQHMMSLCTKGKPVLK